MTPQPCSMRRKQYRFSKVLKHELEQRASLMCDVLAASSRIPTRNMTVITSGASNAATTVGGESVQSSTSLKNLGSKIVKNLGHIIGQAPAGGGERVGVHGGAGPDTRDIAGGDAKMGGTMGFGGSILGEVLVSYSTSSMPASKRHSISATSAHYEELANEAGIDLDAEDVNIEDLRMYRMEDDAEYALSDDSDNEAENHHEEANATNQKLAHKERSILQMVDVLSGRLASLNAVVINRYNGCKSDLDEATEFRSSRTKKLAVMTDDDWNTSTPRKAADKVKRATMFTQNVESGESGDPAGVGPTRLTFRNAPQTDAGRKLAHHFEQEYGSKQASNTVPKFSKTTSGKLKRVDHYKKSETRKQERLHFERKLQSNLDQYVTRAVTELVYRVPDDSEGAAKGESSDSHRGDAAPAASGPADNARVSAVSDVMAREHFPIPMEPNEMNPKLLLCYACERTVFPGGARMFKHFATSLDSQHLFVYMFWFIHCKFFQEDSLQEQTHLLQRVAGRYVGVLSTDGMDEYKDFFYKHYPFVIANAVLWGFHYLCPGSRHLYSNAFKRVLYLQCARILSGVEVTPSSTVEMRTKLFPDEAAEALDELEYHPHHVHTAAAGARPTGTVAGAGSVVPSPLGIVPPLGPDQDPKNKASPPSEGPGGGGGNDSAAAVTATAEGAESRRGRRAGRHGGQETMLERMTKTFRPDPLSAYTGDRTTLKFKPRRQEGLTTLMPRQQRTAFDAAQISPLLQEYLGQSNSTAGRRSENIVRTVPVPWCQRGGSDTYRRHPSRKELHEAINMEHAKAKREFARGRAQAAETLRRTLRHVDADQRAIFKKGPRQVGLKSMDIVTELQQRGALKGIKRPEHHWS